nr:arrestin [Hymenolepis microstoma]
MAINPEDSRFGLYLCGAVRPAWKKLSPSKCVGLYLLNRDYWSNYEFRDSVSSLNSPKPDFRPEHNGIIEGIARFSPWMMQFQGTLYAEVCARCRISPLDLSELDSIKDEVIFSKQEMLCPDFIQCDFTCFKYPPNDFNEYSNKFTRLYEKLGSACALKFPGSTEFHEKPCATYNFPFRFNINSGPDSITIKSIKPKVINGHTAPKTRQELYNDALYGFQENDEFSDYEFFSDSDDDFNLPRIRHPGEPIQKPKVIRKLDIKRQSIKDGFHADSYPWRPRKKPHPKAGIYWTVRVYALNKDETKPDVNNIAELKIRKMTYVPIDTVLRLQLPPQISTDYSLVVEPWRSTDGGVITLIAQLDKVSYRMGEPIKVNIKIHNSSCRVTQQVNIELVQSIRLRHDPDKEWRNVVCRKEVTAERDDNEMPILPATEKLRLQCQLCPWKSASELDKDKFLVDLEPDLLYGIQQPARYEIIPQRRPAYSTLSEAIEQVIVSQDIRKLLPPTIMEREENPYDNCRCNEKKTVRQKERIIVSYEVVLRAILRPQNLQDPLAQDTILRELNLPIGLSNPPKGEIIRTKGPCVTLPVIFNAIEPEKEASIPLANFNIDPKGEMPTTMKPWEPSDGKGFFLVKEQSKEPQSTGSNKTNSK